MLFNARRRLRAVLVVALTLLAGGARAQQAFTLGDVVVYRIGAGGTATLTSAGNPIFLDEYAPDGTLIQSIKMPVSASGGKAIVASGTATQDGLLTRSVDGRCLVIPGYERDLGTGSGSLISGSLTSGAAIPRIVGRVMANGTIDAAAELTDAAILGNFRGAASTDCTSLWVSGSTGGIRFTTFGAAVTTSTLLTGTFVNVRAVAIQSGQLYASSPTRGVAKVGSGLPTTAGASVTRLTGNNDTNDPSAYSFFFADLNGNIPGLDTLYVADDDVGALTKFSLVGSTWVVNGTIGTATDTYRGLTGVTSGGIVTLYVTRKGGSTASGGGELVTLTDASGYNGAFTGTPVVIATAATNTAFRGVALAPAIPITITPSAGAHGHISPATPQLVNGAGPHSFTVTADAGYSPLVGGTCAGTLVGNTYTTAPSSVSCTVVANTTLITRTVTPSASAHGTISPDVAQIVPLGASTTFAVAPAFGYSASVGGTCGGTLSGTTYTTAAVATDCTVAAMFTPLPTYTVTPLGGANGTVTPNDALTVISGQSASFTVIAAPGRNVAVRGTCGGLLSGNTFTTAPVTRDCTVAFAFAQKLVLFVGNSFTFGRVDPVMSYNTTNVTDLTEEMWRADDTGSNADEPHPWGGIPGIFKKLTDQAGLDYDVSISARNAASLRGHYLNSNPAGWDLRDNIASQKWDVVVLQDLSDEPLPTNRGANANLPYFNVYTDKLVAWAQVGQSEITTEAHDFGGTTASCISITGASANTCNAVRTIAPANPNARLSAQVFLYETWARPDMIAPHGDNASGQFYTAAEGLEAMTADFHTAYFDRAAVNANIAGVSPVGDAFLRAVQDGVATRDPYVPEAGKIDLWHTDFFHPSKYGSYLSALVQVATMTGVDPMTFGAGEQAAADLGISPAIALQLQRVARETVMPDVIPPMTTPTVSVPPNARGWNQGSVTVTFAAADNARGWGVSFVSYSLAGAQSDAGTVAAGGTVTIAAEGVTTITYFATDVAGNAETAHALVIRIDSIAPILRVPSDFAVDSAGPGGASVSYEVTVEDNSGLAPALSCLPASGGTLPIGANTISCTAIDAADNAAHASFVVTVLRDVLPPTTDVSVSVAANDAGWNQGAVTVTFAATDNPGGWGVDAIGYSLAGAQSGAGSVQTGGAVTIVVEGDTTITYFATDLAGNAEQERRYRIRIDSIAPTLSLPGSFSIDATGPQGARVTYDVTAADNSGIAPALACLPESGSTLPIGTNTIACTATDAAGNAAHGSFNVTVRRDTTPPVTTVSVSVPANAQGWNTSVVTVTFAAADNAGGWGVSTVSYSLAGAQSASGSVAAGGAIAIAAEGVTTVTYSAIDVAGNVEVPRALVIRVDMTPPVLTVPPDFSVDATSPDGASVRYNATAADNSGLAPALSCLPASGSTLPIGTTTIACAASDAADHSAGAHFTVTVIGAAGQTARLVTAVLALRGVNGSAALTSMLTAYQHGTLSSGNSAAFCNGLTSFARQVAMLSGRTIPVAQATELVASANQIRNVQGCR